MCFLYLESMKPTEFTQLNEEQQMEIIWERGVFVSEKNNDRFKYILYNVDGFYIMETRYLQWNMWSRSRYTEPTDFMLQYADNNHAMV